MGDRGRFEGRTVAVTGAGGFIGNAVCAHLADGGAIVRGIDLDASTAARVERAGAAFVAADVRDRDAIERALDGADLVVHAAALIHEWGSMEGFVRVNVGGTANVLGAAGDARVVHVSSVVVYGYDDPSEQDEDAFHRVHGIPYIDTKSASDRLARRLGAVVVRPGDVYGPGSIPWTVRPIEMARAGQLAVPGRGDGRMLPVYIDDLSAAISLALESGTAGSGYAVWDDTSEVTFEEHFNRLARMVGGREARRLPRPVLELAGAAMERAARWRGRSPAFSSRTATFIDRRGTVSTARSRTELGWQPRVSYERGMRLTEDWLRSEGLA